MEQQKRGIELSESSNNKKNISKQEEIELKEKTKNLSIKEGINYSVMDGAGLRYISPYALSLGANNHQIGLLTSIPSLIGNFSQLLTTKLIEKYSRKKIILFGVLMQALMWLPLLIVGYLYFFKNFESSLSVNLVILIYTLITFFGSFASPAWNSLMRDVVDKESGKYFGKRNKIIGTVVLGVMLVAGLILNFFKQKNEIFFGFAILLSVSLISRLISARLVSYHYEPELKLEKGYYFGFVSFLKQMRKNNFGKFTLFISLIMFATSIASPFFTVYMLKDLNLSYLIYTLITVAGPLSSLLFMPIWGKLADRFGNLRVLRWTGALIPLVPLLWFFSAFMTHLPSNFLFSYLIIIELFSGIVWAGFNLTSITFMYDAVSKQRLALCVAYYNILSGIGVFIGATLGGLFSSWNIHLLGINTVLLIFLISGLARLIVYLLIIPKIKEVREVEQYKKGEFKREVGEQLKNEIKSVISPVYSKFGIYPTRQT